MSGTRETHKAELVSCFRKLYEQGTVNLFEGNLSVRDGDVILMTPSQQDKEAMTADMIAEMDLNGELLSENGYRPSSEYRMHLEIYRLRPDVRAVVHDHSAFASAFALAGQAIRGELAELYMFYGGEIPCCAYGTPGTDAVFDEFERRFVSEGRDAVLLANHGLVAAGQSLKDAFAKAEAVEKMAKIILLAKCLGGEKPLPSGAAEELLERWSQQKKTAGRN